MGKKVKITREMIEEVGVDEVLSLIRPAEALDFYDDSIVQLIDDEGIMDEAEFRNLLTDEEDAPKTWPTEYLITEAVTQINGRSYYTNQEAKQLICDYIDNHLIDCIHFVQ